MDIDADTGWFRSADRHVKASVDRPVEPRSYEVVQKKLQTIKETDERQTRHSGRQDTPMFLGYPWVRGKQIWDEVLFYAWFKFYTNSTLYHEGEQTVHAIDASRPDEHCEPFGADRYGVPDVPSRRFHTIAD